MISVVILTFNEANNIERCIRSVDWSDDILLVDSGSHDDTRQIALGLGARVLERKFDNFAGQRNFAIDHGFLKHNWVLHLDADEVVSDELKAELIDIVGNSDSQVAYLVPSKLIFMGRWLKYSGMYPSYQVRFGQKKKLRFSMIGHGQRELLEFDKLGVVKADLIHFNFSKGISEWIIKHAKYAKDEAVLSIEYASGINWGEWRFFDNSTRKRRMLKALFCILPFRPLIRFTYIYFFRGGFLEGRPGFQYAILIGFYQWMIDLNRNEHNKFD